MCRALPFHKLGPSKIRAGRFILFMYRTLVSILGLEHSEAGEGGFILFTIFFVFSLVPGAVFFETLYYMFLLLTFHLKRNFLLDRVSNLLNIHITRFKKYFRSYRPLFKNKN